MTYGIKVLDKDGYVNLHSDYSSIVYYGEMSVVASPQRPVYVSGVSMPESAKDSNYDMGWIIQYQISGINTDYLLPFYKPNFDGQQIGILDVIKKTSTTWLVNLIYSGATGNSPRVFAFAPLTAIPKPTLSTYGLLVYDENGGLVFTDSKPPLRVDESISITHPSTIRAADKGGCGRFGYSCHVNFTSDKSNYYQGTLNNTSTKLYHIVPSAYGGLAYKNYYEGSESCDGGLGSRKYVFNYQSWASFRGTLSHPIYSSYHKAEWLADYAGAIYQEDASGCGYGGVFSIILGALAVIFTGGGALAFVGGYLAGFALSTPQATPSLKAYETDQVFDTNNPSNLIITDARYYGIDNLPLPRSIIEDPTPDLLPYSGTNEIYNPPIYSNSYDGYYYVSPFVTTPTYPEVERSLGTFWLDSYTNGTFVSSTVRYTAQNIYPQLNETFTTYRTAVYDTFNGYIFSRGTLIMEYATPNTTNTYKLYAVFKKDFEYYNSHPLPNFTSSVPTTAWVISYSLFTGNTLTIYYNFNYINNSSTTSGVKIVIQNVSSSITSYTYNGYTYYRGAIKAQYSFPYETEYSITRI